jgi:hypothetical protein
MLVHVLAHRQFVPRGSDAQQRGIQSDRAARTAKASLPGFILQFCAQDNSNPNGLLAFSEGLRICGLPRRRQVPYCASDDASEHVCAVVLRRREVPVELDDFSRRRLSRPCAHVGAPTLNQMAGGRAGAVAVAVVGVHRPLRYRFRVVDGSRRRRQFGPQVHCELQRAVVNERRLFSETKTSHQRSLSRHAIAKSDFRIT